MSIAKLIKEKKFRDQLIEYAHKHNAWPELRKLALQKEDDDLAWRAMWLLNHLSPKRKAQLIEKPLEFLERGPLGSESYQREAFRVLIDLAIDEDDLSTYFNWAQEAWIQLDHKASLRIHALRAMERVAKLYPELNQEIIALSDSEYTESLSPGIRNQALAIFQSLDN